MDAMTIELSSVVTVCLMVGIILAMLGLGIGLFMGFDLMRLVFPLMALGGAFVMLQIFDVAAPVGPVPLLTTISPAVRQPSDWSWLWEVLSWIGYAVGIASGITLVWKLPRWTWRLFVWFVNPPPVWLCRWLNRPLPPKVRPLPISPQASHVVVLHLVPDDPIYAEFDQGIRTIDAMLPRRDA